MRVIMTPASAAQGPGHEGGVADHETGAVLHFAQVWVLCLAMDP